MGINSSNIRNVHTVVATFKLKSENREEFIKFLSSEDGLSVTRNFEGCISIECYISKDNENTIILWEKWEKIENHEAAPLNALFLE